MNRRTLLIVVGMALVGAVPRGPSLAGGRGVAGQSWHDVKCRRYDAAWSAALGHLGRAGLGREFLARHASFLASNCTRRADVCPRSPEELRLANVMVELSMNFGAASTFAPFACR